MKNLNYEKELIAYAESFVSFIFPKVENVKEIILFGSVARGEAGKESDADLFFNLENEKKEREIKKIIEKETPKFYKSKIAETWILKGIKNPIKVNVGNLEKWKLKRSIISEGILLYGKYKKMPENLKGFVYFNIEPIKDIAKRNMVMRKLFGRKEKNYFVEGIVEKVKGRKLSASSFLVHLEQANQIISLLGKEKISFKFFEVWSDQVS